MHGGPTCIGKFSLNLLIVFRAQILVRTSNLLSLNLNDIHINYVKNLMRKFTMTLEVQYLMKKIKKSTF